MYAYIVRQTRLAGAFEFSHDTNSTYLAVLMVSAADLA